ncbi:hypothetical protein JG687_00009870 [Phytophthora cactorum]|uniref:Uncharacterized protein n=1 Tax=Phytophthora cactorum TaxID=29920 RepID=A0A8T1UB20_9STRA|nr:hypothetical protein JG687_00009870 [Phytophthora cactorum]
MRLVLSTGEVIFCVCVVALALYLSPFFIDEVNVNASNAWEFLLVWDDEENFVHNEVIQSGLNLANLYAMFTMTKINVYEPFGMDPTDWRILDQRATYFVTSGRYSSSDGECRRLWELTYYFTPFGTLKSDLQRLKLLIWLNGMDDVVCEGYMQLLEARPDNCHVHNNVGYEELYATPRNNLESLDKWIALKEEARARGEEDSVPQIQSQIMF